MRRYETTYILRPNLGEALITEVVDRTNDIIKNDGGTIISLDRWGVKKLAYEIKKENLGYYVYFDFAAPGTTIIEMERIFRLDDNVLRFLTIKLADSIDQETIEAEAELAAAVVAQQEAEAEAAEAEEEDKTKSEDTVKTETVVETPEKVTEKDEEVAEVESEKETEAVEETETEAEAETEDTPSKEEPSEEASEEDKK